MDPKRPFIAGNWKMNLDRRAAVELARAVASHASDVEGVELAVFPPSVYLDAVGETLRGSSVALGAQNLYHQPNGAFTGETSATMLVDLGCRYVILGHSERRHVLGETDEEVCRKVRVALAHNLVPIVCVGETLEERRAARTWEIVHQQFSSSLAGLDTNQMGSIVIAYEPVWAIGTGQVALPAQAQQVHADLRSMIENGYNPTVARQVRVLYGGSVKADNARDILAQADVDGALVGGASLSADSFLAIASGAQQR
jgi:triosephosphate isomerase